MGKIVVLGSANADLTSHVHSFPRPGETVIAAESLSENGGKGANQAVACARLKADTALIACVGADSLGRKMLNDWSKDNIDVSGTNIIDDAVTGLAQICIDANGENFIVINSGANRFLSNAVVDQSRTIVDQAEYLLLQLETPIETSEYAAKIVKRNGGTVVLNPAPAKKVHQSMLECVDIITPNETEALSLTGINVNDEDSAALAAAKMHDLGIKVVIITLGSKGVFVSEKDGKSQLVPGYKVSAVDTVAAGDTFNGALLVALSNQYSLVEAARFANAAAAIAVTRNGAQNSIPSANEVQAFITQYAR